LPAREDRFHDVGRQQRQPEDAAHIALRDVLGIADLADRRVQALIERALPALSPSERCDQGTARLRVRLGTIALPSPAATPFAMALRGWCAVAKRA
jgi:hypothetical protein